MAHARFAPGGGAAFERLQQGQLDQLHHGDERQAVGEDAGHVEHLEAMCSWKPMPSERPSSSTTSTIFQISANPPRVAAIR